MDVKAAGAVYLGFRVHRFADRATPVERDFFEYKLYAVGRASTIRDRQIKQLSLFEAADVKARRRYVCLAVEGDGLHPKTQLLVRNKEANRLGRALPKGSVTLTALDPDGEQQYLNRHDVDHTAKDEELRIEMGRALDVVYAYRVVDTQVPAGDRMRRTYEYRIRNHKPIDVHVHAAGMLEARKQFTTVKPSDDGRAGHALLLEHLTDALADPDNTTVEWRDAKQWKIVESTDRFTKYDHRTVHFDVVVEANSERIITYTADYRW